MSKDSYSLSAFDPRSTNFSAECAIAADSKSVINYVHKLRKEIGTPVSIDVLYEQDQLLWNKERAGIKCHAWHLPAYTGQPEVSG